MLTALFQRRFSEAVHDISILLFRTARLWRIKLQSSLKACKASLTVCAVIIILPAEWMSVKLDPVILVLHTVL